MARRRNPLEATNKAMQRGFSGVASTLAISLRLTEGRSSNRIIYAAHRDPWKKRKVALELLLQDMSHLSRASCTPGSRFQGRGKRNSFRNRSTFFYCFGYRESLIKLAENEGYVSINRCLIFYYRVSTWSKHP